MGRQLTGLNLKWMISVCHFILVAIVFCGLFINTPDDGSHNKASLKSLIGKAVVKD